jgi:hypothetical protein
MGFAMLFQLPFGYSANGEEQRVRLPGGKFVDIC